MKTKAQLLRDLKSKNITLELVERFGSKNINDSIKGKRKIGKVNTSGCTLINKEGKKSEFTIPKASLIEYTGDYLKIFTSGYRELDEKEKRILKEWDEIANEEDFKKRSMYDALTDGSGTFWQKRRFFENKNALYLFTPQNGKRLDYSRMSQDEPKCLMDPNVKGDMILMYKIENI